MPSVLYFLKTIELGSLSMAPIICEGACLRTLKVIIRIETPLRPSIRDAHNQTCQWRQTFVTAVQLHDIEGWPQPLLG